MGENNPPIPALVGQHSGQRYPGLGTQARGPGSETEEVDPTQ